jgi:hypothetical protein
MKYISNNDERNHEELGTFSTSDEAGEPYRRKVSDCVEKAKAESRSKLARAAITRIPLLISYG